MLNYFYKDSIQSFLGKNTEEIIGEITLTNTFDTTISQNKSWEIQILILKKALSDFKGDIFFEFSIPRMGKRIDSLVIIDNVVFIIEFKIGERQYHRFHIEQVWDYALDLKNFHEPSHAAVLVPILVAPEATSSFLDIVATSHNDNLFFPIRTNKKELGNAISNSLYLLKSNSNDIINGEKYAKGRYSPTPTIIEAALSLYQNHSVDEITRSDAAAKNLSTTTSAISNIIQEAKDKKKKIICFVTGVPGAGKTLVGLKVATTYLHKKEKEEASVYLSGNGPLVAILQEALARNKCNIEREIGNKITKSKATASVKTFIQNVHHYRDAYVVDFNPPYDHVAIFDEAQRAWTKEQTVKFMKQRKGLPDFDNSEPEFLISCLNRHKDWAVIVCLVGGGQEINTGEAGISEWLNAIEKRFPHWEVHISPNLTDSEYAAATSLTTIQRKVNVRPNLDLHLAVSMRSFRAENLSMFVKSLLDLDIEKASETLKLFSNNYPIMLTRDLSKAKEWLNKKARGSERYGLIVSSQAQRLKPHAIDVKSPVNPVHWFLNDKDDVRSSFYLEDVATEFHIQGLELDWACITWDGDLRYSESGWQTFSFVGKGWQRILKEERKKYLINAYRVLLTRARQGMIIVVPEGNSEDHTRKAEFYDPTYNYLKKIGIKTL